MSKISKRKEIRGEDWDFSWPSTAQTSPVEVHLCNRFVLEMGPSRVSFYRRQLILLDQRIRTGAILCKYYFFTHTKKQKKRQHLECYDFRRPRKKTFWSNLHLLQRSLPFDHTQQWLKKREEGTLACEKFGICLWRWKKAVKIPAQYAIHPQIHWSDPALRCNPTGNVTFQSLRIRAN